MVCFDVGLGICNSCQSKDNNSNSSSSVDFDEVLYEINKIKEVNREQSDEITNLKDEITNLKDEINNFLDLISGYNNTINNLKLTINNMENKVENSINKLSYREGFLTYIKNNTNSQTLDIRCNLEDEVDEVITEITNLEEIDGNYVFTLSKGVSYNSYIGVIVNDEDRVQVSYITDSLIVKVPKQTLNLQTGDKLKLMFKDTTYTKVYGYSKLLTVVL